MSTDLLLAAAGNAAGEATYVEDVFSTYLYEGNGSTQTITNGVDLDGESGLVWVKPRTNTNNHRLHDTERGAGFVLSSNLTSASESLSNGVTSFNSNGFTLGTNSTYNGSGVDFASWTFRKAPKFFDVVTYTGDGVAGRTVSHNLGSVPGCIIVKSTSNVSNWLVYHRGTGATKELYLQLTAAAYDDNVGWNDTEPTDSVFTVGTSVSTNSPGRTYVAYLFAHNDGDGEFGEDADQDIIKCGSFTVGGSGTSVPVEEINLGFEAQWVLLKRTDNGNAAYQEWRMMDNMRGASVTGEYQVLYANSSTSEGTESSAYMYPTSTGFNAYFPGNASYPGAGATYMYIAIRRGPMKVPESSSEVFAIDDNSFAHGGAPAIRTPAVDVVDMGLFKRDTSVERWYLGDRLRQEKYLDTGSTAAETANSYAFFDYMNGWNNYATSLSDYVSYNFRRAPKFFDVVTWTGDGTSFNRRISHNLEQEPRLILLKARNSASYNWTLYYHFSSATVPHERFWFVNTGSPVYGTTGSYQYLWGNAPASTTDFGVGSYNNTANIDYVAYLFGGSNIATTGLYIGNGTSNTRYPTATPDDVRFLLIKEYSATSPWYLFDIERGIVAGNDPYLKLNATDAEVTTTDVIDPVPGGFTVNQTATENLNANGSYYLYYAIK